MATNNFKPFAQASGANVTSQADYEALAALLTGFQSGKASSAQINKALRQSSAIASVVAQFIADKSGNDVLDNGNTEDILANLLLAFKGNLVASNPQYFADNGSANAIVITPTPVISALVDGQVFDIAVAAANTGAVTLKVNALTAYPVVGSAGALQGGEIGAAKGVIRVVWSAAKNSFLIVGQNTTGPLQVAPGTKPNHALQRGQVNTLVTGVVSQARNLSMIVATASASATVTADEVIVNTALGGSQYRIGNFNSTINLATTGAGGMDTGTVPASGFVGIYAIYNPTTGASALLAVNASTQVSEVYSGSNMPSGYTASALLTVVPTSGSQFKLVIVTGRKVSIPTVTLLSTNSVLSSSQVSTTGAVPLNAVSIEGGLIVSSTGAGSMVINVSPSTLSSGVKSFTGYAPASTGISSSYNNMLIAIRGSIYVTTSHSTSGTPTFTINCVGYEV